MSIHEGHLHLNGVLTLFGMETATELNRIIKSETAYTLLELRWY